VTRAVPGALVVLGLALVAPGPALAAPAAAQSAAALAQMTAQATAQAAENANAAFDTLVTPEALRALRRLTDSTRAALEAKDTQAKASAPTQPASGARVAGRQTAAAEKPRANPPARSAGTKPPQQTVAIADIALARDPVRSELRVVAAGAARPVLSEPFRTADGTRLYLTFAGATLDDVAPPALDSLENVFAAVNAAQRDDGVRIAIDATDLDRYGLETAGDTTVLWLTAAAPAAAAPAAPASSTTAAAPDDLRLAGESARAGWNAFRADVARAAAAIGGFATRTGGAIADVATGAGRGIAGGATATGSWFAANIPVGGIARTLTFIALLLAPTAGVLRLMRSRRPSAAAQPAAAPRTVQPAATPRAAHVPIVAADIEVAPITRRAARSAAAPAAAASSAPALTYGPPRPRPLTAAPIARRDAAPIAMQQTPPPARRDAAPIAPQQTASPALIRARKKAEKAIAKAEAKAARIAAQAAAREERAAAKAAAKAEREAAKAGAPAKPGKPPVTRTTADARLWAAKTLAASGADAADIARQTGLSREAAGLLVRTSRKPQHTA
jgi:hypothetical protein